MSSVQRCHLIPALLLFLCGCVSTRPPAGPLSTAWPYSGYRRYAGGDLQFFRDRLFSGEALSFASGSHQLWAGSGEPGALTLVEGGQVLAIYDFGPGTRIEQYLVSPDRGTLYLVANTLEGENIGHLPLARALLEVDLKLELLRVPTPLAPGGSSRGLLLEEVQGWLYSLETPGPDRSTGASISCIDLYSREVSRQRSVGSIPERLRRNGLTFDDRRDRLFALLGGGESTDFEPPAAESGGPRLAVLRPDSLTEVDQLPLREDLDYLGIFPSPRGVLVVGVERDTRFPRTWLSEFDTRLMREISSIDVAGVASDAAVQGPRAVVPAAHRLYLIDLSFLSVAGSVAVPVERPRAVAMTEDAETAALALEDPEDPGRPVVGFFNLRTGAMDATLR